MSNIALVLAPLVAGTVLGIGSFRTLYFIGALLLIPFFLIIAVRFRGFRDPPHESPRMLETLLCVRGNKDIRGVFVAQLILRTFYSVMTIYSPIYFHIYLGFSLSQIGVMFAIMLLPFALFEFPLGRIADKWLGEKEILIAGFLIAGLAVGSLAFIASASLVFWTCVEIATETYFFKHVDGSDANQISLFRATRPISDMLGSTIGSLVLLVLPIQYIFLVIGGILLYGMRVGHILQDTK